MTDERDGKPPKKPREKFPGVDVIRNRRKPGEPPKRGAPPRRQWTPEEIAALPPSRRRRLLVRTVPIMTPAGIVRVGTPSKLTQELIAEIVTNLATGAPVEVCAGAAGISTPTLQEWMARGIRADELNPETGQPFEPPESLYRELAIAVERARSGWWLRTYGVISSGKNGWQGRAWLAERKDPHALGPPAKRLEHSGPGGGAIRIVPSSVEIPAEIPDDHPAIVAASRHVEQRRRELGATEPNGHAANGKSNGANGRHVVESSSTTATLVAASGSAVEIPEERDPDP